MTKTQTKPERIAREVAIISAESGSVELHTLPQSVITDEDLQDYLQLTLEVDSSSDWIACDKLVFSDYRTGKICEHTGQPEALCRHE